MSTTDNVVATIDDVLDEGQETPDLSEDIDVEVVSDEVEDDVVAEEAPKSRRGRPRKNADEVEVQNVPAPAPVEEKSSFTRAKAAKLVEKLKGSVEASAELFIEAYRGRIWLALDHETWGDFLNAELGELRPRLPKAQRLELVSSLKKDAKMSQTAIADALGVDQKTVSNDLRELREQGSDEAGGESVGQDGKSYAGTREGTPRPKSFEKATEKAFDKLDQAIGDLTELTAFDEFDNELGRVAATYRTDVARAMNFLEALQESFNSAPDWDDDEPENEAAEEE